MYAHAMKRLQILIDEELDAELERLSSREGKSKGALIREFVRKQIEPLPPIERDPIWGFAGSLSLGPNSSSEVDDVVYGGLGRSKPRKRRS